MKPSRLLLFFMIFLSSVLLSACTGQTAVTSWGNVSADQTNAYLSDGTFIYAVRLSDGQMAWKYPAEKADTTKIFYAPPLLTGGMVVTGNYNKNVFALDATTGTEKWVFDQALKASRFVSQAALINDLILIPSVDHNLYALNPQNGQVAWKFTAKDAIWTTPVSDGKQVYVASVDHFLYALDPASGKAGWSVDLGASVTFSLAVSEDGKLLYVGTLGKEMIAVNTADGSVAWRTPVGGNVWGTPVLHEGKLYFGDQSGKVNALNAADGSQAWAALDVGAPVIASGVIADNKLVFATETAGIQAVEFSGAKAWNFPVTDGKLYSSPAFNGEKLLVAVYGGKEPLIALNPNGTKVWAFTKPK